MAGEISAGGKDEARRDGIAALAILALTVVLIAVVIFALL